MAKNREHYVVEISDHPDFPAANDCAILTTYKLSKYVNTLFQMLFDDYAGCIIYVDQSQYNAMQNQNIMNDIHPVQLELYFTSEYEPNKNSSKVTAFSRLTDNLKDKYDLNSGKTNFLEKAVGYNAVITQNKTYTITQEGIDIFAPLLWRNIRYGMSKDPKADEFAKKGIIVETSVPRQTYNYQNPMSQNIIYNIIRFADINSIFGMLFGTEDDEYVYNVIPHKPATLNNQSIQNMNIKWLFNAFRIKQRTIYDIANEIGQLNCVHGINMYKDYYSE